MGVVGAGSMSVSSKPCIGCISCHHPTVHKYGDGRRGAERPRPVRKTPHHVKVLFLGIRTGRAPIDQQSLLDETLVGLSDFVETDHADNGTRGHLLRREHRPGPLFPRFFLAARLPRKKLGEAFAEREVDRGHRKAKTGSSPSTSRMMGFRPHETREENQKRRRTNKTGEIY